MSEQKQIVVTGTNRGIGLELVKQLVARGEHVIASTRNGADNLEPALAQLPAEQLEVFACDMRSEKSIAAFAQKLKGRNITGLINNAGVWGHAQSVHKFNFVEAASLYQVNALAPLQLSLALRSQLSASKGKLLHVTSGMSAIGEPNSGGHYGYRMSKIALNMMSKTLAEDLRSDGIASAVIDPGWVKTDMGGQNAPTDAHESAKGILAQYDLLTMALSGSFLSFRGGTKSW